jgi:hypothetical protein
MTQNPWHKKPQYVIAALILFPPLGIALTWLSSWSRPVKIVVTVVMGGLFLQAAAPHFLPTSPPAAIAPSPSPIASSSPVPDPFQVAINKAEEAGKLNVAAQTPTDWRRVSAAWKEAIALLGTVPSTHPRHAVAIQKVAEYQKDLDYAKERVGVLLKPRIARGEQIYKAVKGEAYAWFDEKYPTLSLLVERTTWAQMPDRDQVDLTLYAESLIPSVRTNPEVYSEVPLSSPQSRKILVGICDECWSVLLIDKKRTFLGKPQVRAIAVQGDTLWDSDEVKSVAGARGTDFRKQRGFE